MSILCCFFLFLLSQSVTAEVISPPAQTHAIPSRSDSPFSLGSPHAVLSLGDPLYFRESPQPVLEYQAARRTSHPGCKDWCEYRIDEYAISNNVWGKDKIEGYSAPYAQCIYSAGVKGPDQAGWDWIWPAWSERKVMAYPAIAYGWKPWSQESTTANLPKQVGAINELIVSYQLEFHATGIYNLAFDLWLTRSSIPSPEEITREIMIWIDQEGIQPAGTLVENVVIDGKDYAFYKKKFDEWDYLAFINTSYARSGKINVKRFLEYLLRNAHITREEFLASIEFGNEISAGKGRLELQKYLISVR